MKGLWCAIVGHRPGRLRGSEEPLIRVATDASELEICMDHCQRCGCIVGNVRAKGVGSVERIEIMGRAN